MAKESRMEREVGFSGKQMPWRENTSADMKREQCRLYQAR